MNQIAEHDGVVTATHDGRVTVRITTLSACGGCAAHARCGFAESSERDIEVDTPQWDSYAVGDAVSVNVTEGLGFSAVWWAYLLPALLLLAAVLVPLHMAVSEPAAIGIGIAVVALYYLVLYRFRGRLQRKFNFGIVHREG
ncbi:MAG: SoxR reducing system RseC family protein [Bacteroidales bacterium]|nr:SoxR reducing system RseC family protein [Bacteroidales bacterium]